MLKQKIAGKLQQFKQERDDIRSLSKEIQNKKLELELLTNEINAQKYNLFIFGTGLDQHDATGANNQSSAASAASSSSATAAATAAETTTATAETTAATTQGTMVSSSNKRGGKRRKTETKVDDHELDDSRQQQQRTEEGDSQIPPPQQQQQQKPSIKRKRTTTAESIDVEIDNKLEELYDKKFQVQSEIAELTNKRRRVISGKDMKKYVTDVAPLLLEYEQSVIHERDVVVSNTSTMFTRHLISDNSIPCIMSSNLQTTTTTATLASSASASASASASSGPMDGSASAKQMRMSCFSGTVREVKKGSIYEKYKQVVENQAPRAETIEPGICDKCKMAMRVLSKESQYQCVFCRRVQPYFNANTTNASNRNMYNNNHNNNFNDEDTKVHSEPYKRVCHFDEYMAHFQAKEKKEIPAVVWKAIREELAKRHRREGMYRYETIHDVLKKRGLSDFYANIVAIWAEVNNCRAPTLTEEEEEEMRKNFHLIEEPYQQMRQTDAKFKESRNFPYLPFIFRKLFLLNGHKQFLDLIPKLKCETLTRKYEKMWQSICQKTGIRYIAG